MHTFPSEGGRELSSEISVPSLCHWSNPRSYTTVLAPMKKVTFQNPTIESSVSFSWLADRLSGSHLCARPNSFSGSSKLDANPRLRLDEPHAALAPAANSVHHATKATAAIVAGLENVIFI